MNLVREPNYTEYTVSTVKEVNLSLSRGPADEENCVDTSGTVNTSTMVMISQKDYLPMLTDIM